MSWWNNATQEQRLKQIDAGISLGMTSKQIAMCLGAPIYESDGFANAVNIFGGRHGRKFPTHAKESTSRAGRSGGKIAGRIRARQLGVSELSDSDAFTIFNAPLDENPFATLTQEFEA